MNANTSREEQIMDQRIKVMVFDSGRTDYSCWGNVDFPSNAEALRARDALAKALRAEGAVIKRRTLTNQLRPYGSLGCPDGAVGNVYQITVIRQEGETMAKAMRAGRCEVCGALVIAWRRSETRYSRITTRLLKLLAMANHGRTLHVQEG